MQQSADRSSVIGFTNETKPAALQCFKQNLKRWGRPSIISHTNSGSYELHKSLTSQNIDMCIVDVRYYNGKMPATSSPLYNQYPYKLPTMRKRCSSETSTRTVEDCEDNMNEQDKSPNITDNGVACDVPIVQLFCITKSGYSVLVNVHGFFPYIYCEVSNKSSPKPSAILKSIEQQLGNYSEYQSRVLDVEILEFESIMYFKKSKEYSNNSISYSPSLFYKITMLLPKMIPTCRSLIENGNIDCIPIAYEANIPFILRFLIDKNISTGSWISLDKSKIFLRNSNMSEVNNLTKEIYNMSDQLSISTVQIEFDVFPDCINVYSSSGEWLTPPPVRVLSFDIECVKKTGTGFPEPEKDPVIQISSVVTHLDSEEPICNVIFTLKECAAVAGAFVLWFDKEQDLLLAWREFVVSIDPDILTGYNCINFDMFYLFERAKIFDLKNFFYLSRITNTKSVIKSTRFSSKAFGIHDSKSFNIEGRILWDLLESIRREYKLKSYTLNYVSTTFLKEQKEDVHYSMIYGLQEGTPETRRRIAVYCLKDSLLPLRLMKYLKLFPNIIEMARVTGTTLDILLSRGQQIKVTSQILRKCKSLNFIMPTLKRSGESIEDQYEGATVLEPVKGFYKDPISTLDFASLYPSIMIAHNICYSTLVPSNDVDNLPDDFKRKSPAGHTFVLSSVRKGILPLIVEELISARKKARKEMSETKDPVLLSILDGRQLALKISANSVYGYTGTTIGGQLPCLEISTSITSYGRSMIDFTKIEVEKRYNIANGYQHNATVIYGDTDSVMVQFGTSDISEAMNLGLKAATEISDMFLFPIRLEFEKVYCPFLLMNKKRYAGVLYKNSETYEKIDCKGIETVRRDNCLLVQQVVDTVLKKILVNKDVEGAKEYTRNIIADLLKNKVDLSLLVVSKSLGKDDYTAKLAHVELAKKLRQRDPGSAPNVGDRVSYVIIRGSKGQPQYDRAEDPLYVLEKNLAIDTQHYVDTIKASLIRIFEGVMKDPEKLFVGSHTRSVTLLSSTNSALSSFVKKSLQCLNCKTVIKEGTLCKSCIKIENQVSASLVCKLREFREKEIEYNALWTQCQRCQSSLFQDVICTSRDCPIFYRRTKVKKDIATIGEQLDRFKIDW
ncbi:putative DNA polymerase family B [Cryptosporidium serpentis]